MARLIFFLILIFSFNIYPQTPFANEPTTGILSNESGRYVFGLTGFDYYMLDTETGKLWVLVEIKHGDRENEIFLKPIPYLKHLKLKNADMFKIMPESK